MIYPRLQPLLATQRNNNYLIIKKTETHQKLQNVIDALFTCKQHMHLQKDLIQVKYRRTKGLKHIK